MGIKLILRHFIWGGKFVLRCCSDPKSMEDNGNRREQSGRPLAELSRIISFCHGQNRVN